MKVFKNSLYNCYGGGTVVVTAETASQAREHFTQFLNRIGNPNNIRTDVTFDDIYEGRVEEQTPVFDSEEWEEIKGVESKFKTPKVLIYQTHFE